MKTMQKTMQKPDTDVIHGCVLWQKCNCGEVCPSNNQDTCPDCIETFVIVKKCGQVRRISEYRPMKMDDNSEALYLVIDQSECNKKCDSYYRCAGEYACGYLLRENETTHDPDYFSADPNCEYCHGKYYLPATPGINVDPPSECPVCRGKYMGCMDRDLKIKAKKIKENIKRIGT